MSAWIPASDRVSLKNRQLVLVWYGQTHKSFAVAYSTDKEDAFDPGWRHAAPGNPHCFGVTHWMPLPDGPGTQRMRAAWGCEARDEVLKLADELTNAIDLAEEDIGGARPIEDILGELGPAVDKALGR